MNEMITQEMWIGWDKNSFDGYIEHNREVTINVICLSTTFILFWLKFCRFNQNYVYIYIYMNFINLEGTSSIKYWVAHMHMCRFIAAGQNN